MRFASVCLLLLASAPGAAVAAEPQAAVTGLTAVDGVKVGHHTLGERPTGCTVVLVEGGAVAGVDVRGGAPGTRETDLLDPKNLVQAVHAVVLAGGSAFGLDAASGAVRYLEERRVGYDADGVKVPIVPAAILIDLWVGDDPAIRPGADCGYKAARAATPGPVAEGNVGAGAGATVGKLAGLLQGHGRTRAMKAGIGSAALRMPDGLVVAALTAVNAAGDVVDPASGRVIAGARSPDGRGLVDTRALLRSGALLGAVRTAPGSAGNTTLGVVATNARLTKAQASKLGQMAHDGIARAISPAHTPWDGDTVFALATGERAPLVDDAQLGVIGALAAEALADAILRAVQEAEGLPGIPALRDLK
jgi:L-aminopeptidase/D-esterase-like protein